ncbi:MAG: activator of osmoprotectant transporter ProP [Gemmatimonadetes bacterium]|nr:activator of osmoprotectant transporter ProP [Gemmatimonadota bacterium]
MPRWRRVLKWKNSMPSLSRSDKIGLCSLAVAIVGCTATVMTVEEIRALLGLHPQRTAETAFLPKGNVVREQTAQPPAEVESGLRSAPSRSIPPADPVPEPERQLTALAASASSVLPTSTVASYEASKVLDADESTVWVEGAAGDGIGEWIDVEFPTNTRISRIDIANGYNRGVRFSENGRVRQALLTFSDGSSQMIDLLDRRGIQTFTLTPLRTQSLRLTIRSAYPGTRWSDTALGEIRVWGMPITDG